MIEQLAPLLPLVYYGMIIVMALVELVVPARRETISLVTRWSANVSLHLMSGLIERFVLPVSSLGVAIAMEQAGRGLLHQSGLNAVMAIVAGVLLLDLWGYISHRLYHQVHVLWRMHVVHHAEVDMDFTTTERHHPFESIASLAGTLTFIYLLGIPALSLVLFLLIAGPVTILSHSNVALPERLDRAVRLLIVTPAFHEVHHSPVKRETDSNYGTILTIWDRLFGTYIPPEVAWQDSHDLGLEYFREPQWARLDKTLAMPFADFGAAKERADLAPAAGKQAAE